MKRDEIRNRLDDAFGRRLLVRLRYRWDGPANSDEGFVVGIGRRWVLLHQINGETLRRNGYVAVRVRDIADVRADNSFAIRALVLRGEEPINQPDILLDDLPGLLSSTNAHFPLLSLRFDRRSPSRLCIGRIGEIGEKVTLHKIDTDARWGASEEFRPKDITRIEFGGGYSDALWLVGKDAWRGAKSSGDGRGA